MKTVTADLRAAAVISFVVVLPLAILEIVFNEVNKQNAAGLAVLFGLLWLLPLAFITLVVPMVRAVRAGSDLAKRPLRLVLKMASLVVIALLWGGILLDQMPCFLGVPNCD